MKMTLSLIIGALLAVSVGGQAAYAETATTDVKQVAPMVQQAPVKPVVVTQEPVKPATNAAVIAVKPEAQAKPQVQAKPVKQAKPRHKVVKKTKKAAAKKVHKAPKKVAKAKPKHKKPVKQHKSVQKASVKKVVAVQSSGTQQQANPAQQAPVQAK